MSDPEDYHDFCDKVWKEVEIVSDLRAGVLPPGLIIQAEGGIAGVVVNDPEGGQMVKPITGVL